MAFGSELILGFHNLPKIFEFVNAVTGFSYNEENVDVFKIDEALTSFREKELREAFMKANADIGYKYLGLQAGEYYKDYPIFETPWGQRLTDPWILYFTYNEDCIPYVGVNLSSRYLPTIFDIQDPHGTFSEYPLVFNEITMKNIDICKKHIFEVIPEMTTAEAFLVEKFY